MALLLSGSLGPWPLRGPNLIYIIITMQISGVVRTFLLCLVGFWVVVLPTRQITSFSQAPLWHASHPIRLQVCGRQRVMGYCTLYTIVRECGCDHL